MTNGQIQAEEAAWLGVYEGYDASPSASYLRTDMSSYFVVGMAVPRLIVERFLRPGISLVQS